MAARLGHTEFSFFNTDCLEFPQGGISSRSRDHLNCALHQNQVTEHSVLMHGLSEQLDSMKACARILQFPFFPFSCTVFCFRFLLFCCFFFYIQSSFEIFPSFSILTPQNARGFCHPSSDASNADVFQFQKWSKQYVKLILLIIFCNCNCISSKVTHFTGT